MSKVEAEILRFQQEIERSRAEKSRLQHWHRQKAKRVGSVDSLLSFDSDSSQPPVLPPKGKFASNDCLSPQPPKLPPKKKIHTMKRVSIASEPIQTPMYPRPDYDLPEKDVVKHDDPMEDELSDLPSVKELANKFMPKKSPEARPRKAVNQNKVIRTWSLFIVFSDEFIHQMKWIMKEPRRYVRY